MQELLPNTVDLWWINLNETIDISVEFALLDDQEQIRAQKFRQPQHRDRYILSHSQLRRVLARYLRQSPQSIDFERGKRGKPFILSNRGETPPLQFNLSHSGDAALIGISHAPVGVDVEQFRTLTDSLSMAQRFFSEKEFIFLQSLHESERAIAFLKHWVCKEAYVKATGDGLTDQLDQAVVNVNGSGSWDSLPQGDPQSWKLELLRPTAQTVAAAVVQQQSPLEVRWQRKP